MRTINIIILLLVLSTTWCQAQNKSNKSDKRSTIKVTNENGELSIAFKNNIITEFIINDKPVAKDQYDNYQAIVDEFSNDGTQPIIPPTPAPPVIVDDRSETFSSMIIGYLTNEDLINSTTKYKVHISSKYVKVDGQKYTNHILQDCLDLYYKFHGHKLNIENNIQIEKF